MCVYTYSVLLSTRLRPAKTFTFDFCFDSSSQDKENYACNYSIHCIYILLFFSVIFI